MEHRREFIENCPYGKHIADFLNLKDMQKRPQARKPIFLGLESEKSENKIPIFEIVEEDLECAHNKFVHNGSYAFPNELMRFRI